MKSNPHTLSVLVLALATAFATPLAQAQDDKPQVVNVIASAPRDNALETPVSDGALGTRSALDTPFSVTTVDLSALQDRQVYSLAQAFDRTAAVSSESLSYTIYSTDLIVRGLELDYENGYRLDGLPIYAVGLNLPYDHLERIDLLEGLSGFMYGFGAPGGIVNFTTKRAGTEPVTSVDVGYHSDGIFSEHVDLGRRFGDDARFGIRFNATHEEGKTYDGGHVRSDAQSLALDARLTNRLTLTLDAMHQTRDSSGEVSVLYLGSYTGNTLPAAISGRTQLATPGTYTHTRFDYVGTGLSYRLADDWTLSARVGRSDVTEAFVKDFSMLDDVEGDYDGSLLADRNTDRFDVAQAMLEGHFTSGALDNHVVAGVQRQALTVRGDTGGFYNDTSPGNLYTGNPNVYTPTPIAWGMYESSSDSQSALFASDTLSWGQWSAIGGARLTNYHQETYAYPGSGGTNAPYHKNAATPTVALMFKPNAGSTVYASYVESLESGTIVADNYANAGEELDPLKSRQIELGAKMERRTWSGTLAAFRIQRGAEYGNADNVYVESGMSTYRGIEASGSVRPVAPLNLGAGLTWMRAVYGRGTDFDGNAIPAAPDVVGTLFADLDVPQLPGLKLHAGGKYTGSAEAIDPGGLRVPAHTTFDAGVVYATRVAGHDVTYRLQVNNVFDRRYWAASTDTQIVPGLPRTVSANVKLDF